jgi:hypothetical protein
MPQQKKVSGNARVVRYGSSYDNGLKQPECQDRVEFCQLIGSSLPSSARKLPEELPGRTLRADWLMGAVDGPITHVEFERSPRPDLGERIFRYRGRLADEYPGRPVEQYVVLLDDGNPDEIWGPDENSWVRFKVVKLRERDPAEFLAKPGTALFAVLTKADDNNARYALLRTSLKIIKVGCDERRQKRLMGGAIALAGIHLSADQILDAWEEADVPFDVAETELYHVVFAQGEARGEIRGEARGEARGKAHGEVVGQARMLRYLLIDKFGDTPDDVEIVERLLKLKPDAAVHAVNAAKTLDDLRD